MKFGRVRFRVKKLVVGNLANIEHKFGQALPGSESRQISETTAVTMMYSQRSEVGLSAVRLGDDENFDFEKAL